LQREKEVSKFLKLLDMAKNPLKVAKRQAAREERRNVREANKRARVQKRYENAIKRTQAKGTKMVKKAENLYTKSLMKEFNRNAKKWGGGGELRGGPGKRLRFRIEDSAVMSETGKDMIANPQKYVKTTLTPPKRLQRTVEFGGFKVSRSGKAKRLKM